LFLSSMSGINDISTLDNTFLTDKLHASIAGTDSFWFLYDGVPGSAMGDSVHYRYDNGTPGFQQRQYTLNTENSGEAFIVSAKTGNTQGISYSGSYKTILLSFTAEYINNDYSGMDPIDTLLLKAIEFFGGIVSDVYDGQPFRPLPNSFILHQNYPNPFNPTTTISYTLKSMDSQKLRTTKTSLKIYNTLGQEVKSLLDEVQSPGIYSIEWDGTGNNGNKVTSGVYFYRLKRGDESSTNKMILLK